MKHKNEANNLDAMHEELAKLAAKAKAISLAAEGRDMTNSEKAEMDDIVAAFNQTEARINAANVAERFDDMSRPMPRRSIPDDAPFTEASTRRPARTFTGAASKADSWGGPAAKTALVNSPAARGAPHPRLLNAASTYGSEGLNEDGGFAVPSDFRANILSLIQGDDSLMALCDQQSTVSNSLSLPIDAVSPHDTTAGVLVNWGGEGSTIAQSKPKLGAIETKLHKLHALVPLTDELMEGAPAVSRWLPAKVGQKFNSAQHRHREW